MQPAARLAAALELLEAIETAMSARALPADVLTSNYFRARRYAGSKDRRAISDMVYTILRGRGLYMWALESAGQGTIDARALLIAYLAHTDSEALTLFGTDARFAPAAISADEEAQVAKLKALDWSTAPAAANANVPAWAQPGFERRFGGAWQEIAAALCGHAPLDIRLNPLKAGNQKFQDKIKSALEGFEKTKLSPIGYRAEKHVNLGGSPAYRDGLVEVQDEAAQVASLLVEAGPGQQVVDLCAGAGGKSLLIAATMKGKGQVHACDISGKRLSELKTRAKRAAAHNIQPLKLPLEGEARTQALAPLQGKADRVVLDVPCTGSGTWRRSPDQRWRFDKDSLTALRHTQESLLHEGAGLVGPGGRLVYMTCSVLPEENEDVIRHFLESPEGQGWQVLDYRAIWSNVMESPPPESLALMPEMLQLAPVPHETDGFFVAILGRST
ncbi:RsmB/NOP family class I SAM-dependent RNA methyltransferase [Kordiimonas marina]|uniref:RsmB/NOP family class I SAM-dependent RNA methyltransferase n=1 Tax=Kordiimonas marina TaxID=2872312 RepID=UPI001FF27CB1|nr:RsmB/NOP family class I SAM-dependent RNA methyltransferase [Kordiimonas marina]MCJ9429004.1 RsmB/NOP family class I SAM-dependent RNA methyltransferase [Kordiimonas marina]